VREVSVSLHRQRPCQSETAKAISCHEMCVWSVPLFAIVLLQLCMYLCTFGFLNYAQIRPYAKYVQRNFYFFINNLRNHIGSICAVNSGGVLLIKYLFFSFD